MFETLRILHVELWEGGAVVVWFGCSCRSRNNHDCITNETCQDHDGWVRSHCFVVEEFVD